MASAGQSTEQSRQAQEVDAIPTLAWSARALYYDGAYGPFGEPYAQSGTTDVSFTGMNQDTVVNLYDFPAREYGIQGRWPSPDPAGISSVSIKDPQTLNRYAYVRNSPLNNLDPTGMYCDVQDASEGCGEGDGSEGEDVGVGVGDGDDGSGGYGNIGDCYESYGAACDGSLPDNINDDPCTGNPGLCDPGDPCSNPYSAACSDPFGGSGPVGWGNGTSNLNSGGDPCAYLNDSGTGVESTDNNSSPSECQSTGGVWYPDGGGISIAQDGTNVTVYSATQLALAQASRAAWHTMILGQAVGTVAGCGIGVLVASGATAVTETYPLAGQTLPEGCIGGAAIGFFEALPYSMITAIAEFGWVYATQ